MSSQDLDQINDSTCKTNVKDCDRSQKIIDDVDLDDDKSKNEKRYQDLVKSINYLKKFDWFDANNPQLKTPPSKMNKDYSHFNCAEVSQIQIYKKQMIKFKLLTPAAFWFMACAEYFPRSLTIGGQEPTQMLTEILQKIERQQIQQTIRVKDMNYSNHKSESVDEQSLEQIQKIKQSIRKLKFDKPQANIRNSAELKEDYTFEDDLYVINVRNDLLDLYATYLHPEFQQTNQQSCSSSESTMIEEDSRHLFITKEELAANGTTAEKVNPESAGLVKEIEYNTMGEEMEINFESSDKQTINQQKVMTPKQQEQDQVNDGQVEDIQIEIQVNTNNNKEEDEEEEGKEDLIEEIHFNEGDGEELEGKQQDDCFTRLNLPKPKERCFNEEEVLKQMKKQDLDEIINLYQYHLVQQEKELKVIVDSVKQNIDADIVSERIIYTPQELDMTDILVDIHQYNHVEQEYLNFLENKQQYIDFEHDKTNQNQNQKKQHVKQQDNKIIMEDMACQICNDGDYTDDDLIVFCSKCNVSVHQRCYGIPKIPNDDWICELCLSFGPDGKYLRCALCTKRGGAMKPSKIPITSNVFQHTNTSYYEFQKTCKAGPPNKKNRYQNPNEKQTKPSSSSKQISQENEEIEDENDSNAQYYDFHYLKEFSVEELQNEPKPYFVWCHISCTLWTPECFFDDKNYYTNIKGLENIDKQRFKLECAICKQKKAGSCVQCAKTKCMEAFHPECARRANIYMEIRNTDKLAYLIYCERHTPLKLRRLLEHKEKKYKEEIIKFCRSIERSREFRKKERNTKKERDRQLQKEQKRVPVKKRMLISAKKIRQQITKNEEESHKEELEFQHMLINKMIQYVDNMSIEDINKLKEQSKNQDEANNSGKNQQEKSESSEQKSTLKINRWQNKVFARKEEPFWKEIQYKSLSTLQIYKRYKRIQRDKAKKKEFKQIYCKIYSVLKNIRIVSKEEFLREKEKKKQEKQQKRQLKIQEIFLKTQERDKKKQELQQIKDQKEAIKKQKTNPFVLSNNAIRRTNKKRDKINDKKQLKLAKQAETVEQIVIVPHNYEPVDETSEQIYCICRKKYQEGDQMMACERCDEWYHFECIGFQGTIDQADNIEFICKFCDVQDTNAQQRSDRKQCYGHLFLNYDEPNYDFLKDIVIKKLKTEQPSLEKVEEEEQEEEIQGETTGSNRKRSNSKIQKSQKKQTQKNKAASNSKKQENSDQTTTTSKKSKKQSEKNNNNTTSKISEVKAKLDYSEAQEEIFEDDEDEDDNNDNNQQNLNSQLCHNETENQHLEIEIQQNQQNNLNENTKLENKSEIKLESVSQSSLEAIENKGLSKEKIEESLQDKMQDIEQDVKSSEQIDNSPIKIENGDKMEEEEEVEVENVEKVEEEVEKVEKEEVDDMKNQKQAKNENVSESESGSNQNDKQEDNENINELNQFVYSLQKEKSDCTPDEQLLQITQQSSSQASCNLSKQNSENNGANSNNGSGCNISNIDAFKFKQKSIKDFFKRK